MGRIPVLDVAQHGWLPDPPEHLLPPGAWTDVTSMRIHAGGLSKTRAVSMVRTPSIAPYGLFYILGASGPLWVYAGLTDVRAFAGSTDAEITRVSGDYTGTASDQWNGGVFNGLLILNNGVDVPQVWSPPATGTKLVDLPNWTGTWKTKVIRPFKNFLVALDITKSGTRTSRMVKWSHTADTSYPSSWDEADATKDAGENILRDGQVPLVDCLPLGEVNVLYTEEETWRMSLSGTSSIFNFFQHFPKSGLLGQGALTRFTWKGSEWHLVVTRDDIVVHNLGSRESVATDRVRDTFFDLLDLQYSQLTKVVHRLRDNEIWICFPAKGGGGVLATAYVWNMAYNTWTSRTLPSIRSVVVCPIPISVSADLWSSDQLTWDSETQQTWQATESLQLEDTVLFGNISGPGIYAVTQSVVDGDGTSPNGRLVRGGITLIPGDNGPVQDPRPMKLFTAIWPHVQLAYGTSVTLQIRFGWRDHPTPESVYTWTADVNFVPGTDEKVDVPGGGIKGRYFAFEIRDAAAALVDWKLVGYELDIEPLGGR